MPKYFTAGLILSLLVNISNAPLLATEKWLESKSEHLIVYYNNAPESFIDKLIDKAEDYYNEIADDLGFRRFNFWLWDNRAKVYVYDGAAEYQAATGLPPWSAGAAVPRDKIIHTFPNKQGFLDVVLPHEMAHIIFREFVGFNNTAVPLWLDEGVASYEQGARRQGSKEIVKQALAKDTFISLSDLCKINPLSLGDEKAVDLFYAEALSLIDYLIKKFGQDSFVSFCQGLRDKKNLDAAIRYAYGFADLEDLNEAWQKSLK